MWSCHFSHAPFPFLSSRSSLPVSSSFSCSATAMGTHNDGEGEGEGRSKFLDFPFVSTSHKNLMLHLVSTLETRFTSHLLPSSLPPHVQSFMNHNGSAQASLQIRSGQSDSPVDFVLGSWVHSSLPTGGSLDITSLSAYLNLTNDSPNFVIELIRSSPTMMILILDLPPRKDLVLWPDDLKTFYEDTQLDKHRQAIEKIPEVKPYYSSSLYIRAASSPTAIMVTIATPADGGEERMEEIIRDHLDPISKQVLGIWLDHCACAKREVGEAERADLKKRDGVTRSKTLEIDLGSSFPRLFGQEVANQVLEAMREYFTV